MHSQWVLLSFFIVFGLVGSLSVSESSENLHEDTEEARVEEFVEEESVGETAEATNEESVEEESVGETVEATNEESVEEESVEETVEEAASDEETDEKGSDELTLDE